MKEYDEWDKDAMRAKTQIIDLLFEHFGPRCKDVEENCICCQRWQTFDAVFKNPYDKVEE